MELDYTDKVVGLAAVVFFYVATRRYICVPLLSKDLQWLPDAIQTSSLWSIWASIR